MFPSINVIYGSIRSWGAKINRWWQHFFQSGGIKALQEVWGRLHSPHCSTPMGCFWFWSHVLHVYFFLYSSTLAEGGIFFLQYFNFLFDFSGILARAFWCTRWKCTWEQVNAKALNEMCHYCTSHWLPLGFPAQIQHLLNQGEVKKHVEVRVMDGHAATPTCMRETSIPIPKRLLFCLVNFTESKGFHTVRSMQRFT